MDFKKNIDQRFSYLVFTVFLCLFLLSSATGFFYTYSVKKESAFQITKVLESSLKQNKYREVIYSLSNAKMGNFESVSFHTPEGDEVFSLPPNQKLHPQSFYDKDFSFLKPVLEVEVFFDENRKIPAGIMLYRFNLLGSLWGILLFTFLGMVFLIPVLLKYKRLMVSETDKNVLEARNKTIVDTANQVWHDLNQPMQLLYSIATSDMDLDEADKDSIRLSCDDMKEILQDLKNQENATSECHELSVKPLAAVLTEISERERLRSMKQGFNFDFKIEPNALASFSKINETELRRVMANLVDNALLASKPGSLIEIRLRQQRDRNLIAVIDNGLGMTEEKLALVGKRGVSFRADGSGLGLSHAVACVGAWGGSLDIESTAGVGTTICIELPIVETPNWYSSGVELQDDDYFILVDDQEAIHRLVKTQIKTWNREKTEFFKDISSFHSWFDKKSCKDSQDIYVIDYDLGTNHQTGLDVIEELGIASKSVLMTNYYGDEVVQNKAKKVGVKIFPKTLLNQLFIGDVQTAIPSSKMKPVKRS